MTGSASTTLAVRQALLALRGALPARQAARKRAAAQAAPRPAAAARRATLVLVATARQVPVATARQALVTLAWAGARPRAALTAALVALRATLAALRGASPVPEVPWEARQGPEVP